MARRPLRAVDRFQGEIKGYDTVPSPLAVDRSEGTPIILWELRESALGIGLSVWRRVSTRCFARAAVATGQDVDDRYLPCDQLFRLVTFFALREAAFAGAGAQHAAASEATRWQSSGWPSQQSLTRNAITDRMPSTSER